MRRNISNILLGLFWIVAGIGIAAAVVGRFDLWGFIRLWWPLFLIIPCFLSIVKHGFGNGSFIGVIIGVLFLLSNHGIVDGYWIRRMIVPIILIVIGLNLILKPIFKKTHRMPELNIVQGNQEHAAVFSSQKIRYPNEVCLGGKLDAVFGSLDLDLRDAIIQSDIVFKVSSVFGSAQISVPSGVRVKVYSSSVFGGTDNKTVNQGDAAFTIYFDTSCMFGGVTIK